MSRDPEHAARRLPDRRLVDVVLSRAARAPTARAILDRTVELSWGDVGRRVRGAALRLRELGVEEGDRVVVRADNCVGLAIAYLATHLLDAVAVPVGPDMPAETVRTVLAECRPKRLLNRSRLGAVEDPECAGLASDLDEVASCTSDSSVREGAAPCDDTPADLLFTTGTTGRPKGVLLSHRNVSAAALNINAFIGVEASDLEVVPIPLSHSFGLGRLRSWALVGNVLALEPGLVNPAALVKRMTALRATGLALVPAGFAVLRRTIRDRIRDVADHLRYIEIGSAALGRDEREWLLDRLPGTRICHHYGLTEASRAVFRDLRASPDRPGLVGRAGPNVSLRIASADGTVAPPGEPGEIQVSGGVVMLGYWNQPDLTARRLRAGWLGTGDRGWMDDEGWVYLQGRASDVINVGGLKVAPEEIEAALRDHPDVLDAACVGEPDPEGLTGERIRAFLVPAPGGSPIDEGDLVAYLRTRLSEHQIPRAFEHVASIPRTASGKVQRARLRGGAVDAPTAGDGAAS